MQRVRLYMLFSFLPDEKRSWFPAEKALFQDKGCRDCKELADRRSSAYGLQKVRMTASR